MSEPTGKPIGHPCAVCSVRWAQYHRLCRRCAAEHPQLLEEAKRRAPRTGVGAGDLRAQATKVPHRRPPHLRNYVGWDVRLRWIESSRSPWAVIRRHGEGWYLRVGRFCLWSHL